MDTKQLEQVIRAIMAGDAGRPALADVTSIGDAQLPEEFINAAKTLAHRSRNGHEKSILRMMTQGWV